MPELSTPAVAQFWKSYEDPAIYRILAFMESVEDWTLDGDPQLEEAITRLASELDDIADVDIEKLERNDAIIRIACNLKMARCLRFLHVIDQVHPGTASKLLVYAEEAGRGDDDPTAIFLRRNVVFERLRLLSRVFSPERIKVVSKALEEE